MMSNTFSSAYSPPFLYPAFVKSFDCFKIIFLLLPSMNSSYILDSTFNRIYVLQILFLTICGLPIHILSGLFLIFVYFFFIGRSSFICAYTLVSLNII